jgi:hypothetical protein
VGRGSHPQAGLEEWGAKAGERSYVAVVSSQGAAITTQEEEEWRGTSKDAGDLGRELLEGILAILFLHPPGSSLTQLHLHLQINPNE